MADSKLVYTFDSAIINDCVHVVGHCQTLLHVVICVSHIVSSNVYYL